MLSWFEARLNPYPSAEPSEPPRGLIAFCLHYMEGAKVWLAIMAVTAAAIAILEISLFGFLGSIIDWLGAADRATLLQTEGPHLAFMAVVILIIFPALVTLNSMIIHQTLLGNLPQRIRWMAHRYLIRQSMSYFQDEFAGRIAAKLMQTSLAVREVAMKVLDVLVFVVVYFIGAIVLAASNDVFLAIPFVIWLALYALLLANFVPRITTIAEEQADARSMMTGRIVDSYTNIATVKLFSHSSREEGYAREAMDEFLGTVRRQMRLVTRIEISIAAINMGLLFSLGALGIWLWLNAQATPGAVALSIAIAMRLLGFSQWIMWEMSALFENVGTVRDGINSISMARLVRDRVDAPALKVSKGDIQFEAVQFSYGSEQPIVSGKRRPTVFENLNLRIEPGEKIGLVGRSGAGKSTLVNMLLRFYDIQGGRILIDGTDIADVTQESLRENVGVVTQDTSLLHRSVRENIAYGRPDATEAEILRAAKLAEAHDFIEGLEDSKGHRGFDAHVGERGVKLSGGQRQRIAIARVLLKDAPILVLDEATSALDSEVEAAIQDQLALLMEGKTVVAIAHRLSTIAAMDRLIVLDAGKIVEEGTHSDLLALGGHYARLWQRQSGGFLLLNDEFEAAE